jgi:PIN domain nuclease of toxin-antitoxin system
MKILLDTCDFLWLITDDRSFMNLYGVSLL